MKKILVPTDFSKNSKKALRFAAEIAAKAGANLEILHVNTAAAYAPVMPEYYTVQFSDLEDYAESAADDLRLVKRDLTDLKKFADIEIETRVEEGFLYSTLNRIEKEDGCDLLVMGTKGATGATEFFVGSNTEKVIRTADCPVLVVPDNAKDFKIKTVVLATTLRPDQAIAFKTLAEWQKYFNFEVKILYLNNPGGFDSMKEIEAAADEFRKNSGVKNADLFTSVNTFNEEKTILQFSNEAEADLIVMATHQRRGIPHLMFGSLAEDTANHSEIPVLCIQILK